MANSTFEERKAKMARHDSLQLIWQWATKGDITFSQFQALLKEREQAQKQALDDDDWD